jgi:cell division protease FtsH
MENLHWKRMRRYFLLAMMASAITTTSACTKYFEKPLPTKTYSQFIQEVKQGQIKKVGLSTDRTKAVLQDKNGVKTMVNLPNDPQLLNILTTFKVEIYVVPKNF